MPLRPGRRRSAGQAERRGQRPLASNRFRQFFNLVYPSEKVILDIGINFADCVNHLLGARRDHRLVQRRLEQFF